jgi:hypothetical protein
LQCSIVLALASCGGPDGGQSCEHDSDCPSHFCKADGTCAAGGEDGGPNGIDAPAGSNSDGSTGACTPNHDGTISADEIPLAAGQMANYRIATNVTQNTAGTSGSDGTRTWDLSGQLSGDRDTTLALTAPTGQWWASKFTTATYSTPLGAGSDVLVVFEITPTAVELLGIVSPASGGPTDLKYSPPATILKIPFKAGDTWSSSSTVSGTLDDVIANYTETYTSTVDAVGTMKTPYGTFPVLRVATQLADLQLGVQFNANKTFAWQAECFGTVAKITSGSNESGEEFSADAEVDRLAP